MRKGKKLPSGKIADLSIEFSSELERLADVNSALLKVLGKVKTPDLPEANESIDSNKTADKGIIINHNRDNSN